MLADLHRETGTVGRDSNANELSPRCILVGDERRIGVVFVAGGGVLVKLIGRLNRRNRFEQLDRAGCSPLRGPLFMIATDGAIVRTRVGWFEISIPWCVT